MKWIAGAAAISIMVLLSGCSSRYVMSTRDGHMIMTDGKPEVDKDTGLVKYTDQAGNEIQINSDEISSIIER